MNSHFKNYILLFITSSISLFGFSQEYDVEIESEQIHNEIIISAKNHSNVRQEVVLTLEVKNLRGYRTPITKLVNSKEKTEVVKLKLIPGKQPSLLWNYNFKPNPTVNEIALQDQKLREKTVNSVNDINKGIVLFYKDGCPRCAFVTTYMLDNNIDFKLLDITSNKESHRTMWEILKGINPTLEDVDMPVVLVNGKINYNMEDLQAFSVGLPKGL